MKPTASPLPCSTRHRLRWPTGPAGLANVGALLSGDGMTSLRPSIVVSGGQTGADRAALDFAIAHGITHAGFCPRGRKAEDGRIPERYNLEETRSDEYPERTKLNIETADATVIFHPAGMASRGSALTARHAKKLGKPCLILGAFPDVAADATQLAAFLRQHAPRVLNVAGSRESSAPGIGEHVLAVLAAVVR